jgi:ornithine carrier protein
MTNNSGIPLEEFEHIPALAHSEQSTKRSLLELAAKDIVCGSTAGMMSKLVEHPFDTIKVRLQTQSILMPQSNQEKLFSGPLNCLQKTWRTEGIRGLYQVRKICFFFNHNLTC